MQTDKIIKDSTKYTIGTIIAQVIGVCTSIATRKYLTPEMMGIWATFLLILNYALFADLGVFTAVEVRIPYLRGKNMLDEIQKIRNIAFTVGLFLSFAMSVALVGISFFLKKDTPAYIILGLRMIAFIIAATLFYNLYIVMLRADKNFTLLSKSVVFNSAATLIFIVILAHYFNLKGLYFATFFATAASFVYLKLKTKYKLRLNFNPRQILSLSKVGLPLIVAGVVYTILMSVDKIMIIKMIGAKELGYYSIAILALTYTHTFPKLFGIVTFPTMQEEFGRADSKEQVLEYVKQPSELMAYIFPALLGAAYFAIPVLVYYALPKYMPGIDSMKILLCGCFFISLVSLARSFIVTMNKQIVLIPLTGVVVGLGILVNYFMIKMGKGISGVALGTSLTYFIYFIVISVYALRHCEKLAKILIFFIRVCIPFIYALVIILALELFVKINSVIFKAIVQGFIFYLAYSPMLLHIHKKTKVFSHVLKIFKKERDIENVAI